MKPALATLLSTLLALPAAAGAQPAAAPAAAGKPRVMILGTFHFEGSATDQISVTMGDVLTPERQAEIEDVVERLAGFAPTKIMVEALPAHEERLNAGYRAWRAGEEELTAHEADQIGMRLARRLGHDRIYAVDHPQPMDFERLMGAAQAAGQRELLAWFQTTMTEVQRQVATVQAADRSILDALRFHNGDWAHAGNGLYLELARMGSAEDPAGAEEVGAWYERNLKIYANIARATRPGDRVLVIFGSGHLAQLASFFDQSPSYEWVSALEALGEGEGGRETPRARPKPDR